MSAKLCKQSSCSCQIGSPSGLKCFRSCDKTDKNDSIESIIIFFVVTFSKSLHFILGKDQGTNRERNCVILFLIANVRKTRSGINHESSVNHYPSQIWLVFRVFLVLQGSETVKGDW